MYPLMSFLSTICKQCFWQLHSFIGPLYKLRISYRNQYRLLFSISMKICYSVADHISYYTYLYLSFSPQSDSSLLNVTLHMKESDNFGHVPTIAPKPTHLAEALSQIQHTAVSATVTTIYTGCKYQILPMHTSDFCMWFILIHSYA